MTAPIGPVALGTLTVATWAVLGLLRAVHHYLNVHWPVRQAIRAIRDADKEQP